MDKALYISMSGAKLFLESQAVIANNIANASTTGFKADLQHFKTHKVEGPGFKTRDYAGVSIPRADFNKGSIIKTGNPLDVAIQKEGFFAVQNSKGEEAYTQAGNFQLSSTGQLVTTKGYPVLGNGGPITIDGSAEKIEISADGSISIKRGDTISVVNRLKLVQPESLDVLRKGYDGYFYNTSGSEFPISSKVKVTSGALETSNVNIVSEMTKLITSARRYEEQMNMIKKIERKTQRQQRF